MPPSEAIPPAELDEVASAFSRACRNAEVPHAFTGGIAVVAWGEPRTTSDVDVLVDLEENAVDPLVEAIETQGLEVEARDLRIARQKGGHATVFTDEPGLHVDVRCVDTADARREIEDAVEVPLETGPIPVVRPEDLVAHKVRWSSDRDLEDARSILARRWESIDRDRLRRWAKRLDVLEEVQALLNEVENEL